MTIGLSRTATSFEKYEKWLGYFGVKYEVLDFEKPDSGLAGFRDCAGLILTGGVDIYPEIYCDWDTPETKGTYNPARDGFELKLMEAAVREGKPVLGICRGQQLINVFFEGSLIFDIPSQRNVEHDGKADRNALLHEIQIFRGTLLHEITGIESGKINSYHHQAVDRLGNSLIANCRSTDGIVEGIEYEDKTGKPFLLGIQWHPERSDNPEEVLSAKILERFIKEC